MERAFPEAKVTGYRPLVASMKNDPKDRHVAAAGVEAGAKLVVTNNLKDFANLPRGLAAKSADAFLSEIFALDPDAVLGVIREQAAALKKPPVVFDKLLDGMQRLLPSFIGAVRQHVLGSGE